MRTATIVTLFTALALVLTGCAEIDYQLRKWTDRDYSRYQTQSERDREAYLQNKSKEPSVALREIASAFNSRNLIMPNGNRIRVCSDRLCNTKQIYRLQGDTLQRVKSYLDSAWTARGERNSLERGLAYVEQVMRPATNISSMSYVGEALNVTSVLMVMYRYNMIRYHDLLAPQWRGGTQYAVLRDRNTGELFGIDVSSSGNEVRIFPWKGAGP